MSGSHVPWVLGTIVLRVSHGRHMSLSVQSDHMTWILASDWLVSLSVQSKWRAEQVPGLGRASNELATI